MINAALWFAVLMRSLLSSFRNVTDFGKGSSTNFRNEGFYIKFLLLMIRKPYFFSLGIDD